MIKELLELLEKGNGQNNGTMQIDIEKNNKGIVILFFESFGRFTSRFSVYL